MFILISILTIATAFVIAFALGPYKGFAAIAGVLLTVLAVMFARMGAAALLVAAYGGAILLPVTFGFLLGLRFRSKK